MPVKDFKKFCHTYPLFCAMGASYIMWNVVLLFILHYCVLQPVDEVVAAVFDVSVNLAYAPLFTVVFYFCFFRPPKPKLSIKSLIDEGLIQIDIVRVGVDKDGDYIHRWKITGPMVPKLRQYKDKGNRLVLCYPDGIGDFVLTKQLLPYEVRLREKLD